MLYSVPATTRDAVAVIGPFDPAISVPDDQRVKVWQRYKESGFDESLLELNGEPWRYWLRGLNWAEQGAANAFAGGNDFLTSLAWLSLSLVSIDGPGGISAEDLDRERRHVAPRILVVPIEVLEKLVPSHLTIMYLGLVAVDLSQLSPDQEKKSAWQSGSDTKSTETSTASSAETDLA